jgi:hypothetical protein
MEPKRIDVAKNEVAKSSTNLGYAHKVTTTGKKISVVQLGVMETEMLSTSLLPAHSPGS